MGTSNKKIHSVEKSLQIVEALKQLDEAGITEIAEYTGLKKATVHHHLCTLKADDFVVQDKEKYRLGIRFLEYGEYTRQKLSIFQVGVPEVDNLAQKTGELGNMLIEECGRGIHLYRARGEGSITIDTGPGSRVYLHHTGLGKAILAHLPRERVEEIIEEHGLPQTSQNTITDPDALFDELETIRKQGYAVDKGERVEEVWAVAAPVMKKSEVLGAVSVAGPSSRFEGDRLEERLPSLVMKTADVISVNITYS